MLKAASPPLGAGIPPLSGPSSGSLGLLIFGELLKPDADYGLILPLPLSCWVPLGKLPPPRASVFPSLDGVKVTLPHT